MPRSLCRNAVRVGRIRPLRTISFGNVSSRAARAVVTDLSSQAASGVFELEKRFPFLWSAGLSPACPPDVSGRHL